MNDILGWIAVIFNIFGAILNIKKNSYGFLFFFIASLIFFIMNIVEMKWFYVVLFLFFMVLNIYGLIKWRLHEKKK